MTRSTVVVTLVAQETNPRGRVIRFRYGLVWPGLEVSTLVLEIDRDHPETYTAEFQGDAWRLIAEAERDWLTEQLLESTFERLAAAARPGPVH